MVQSEKCLFKKSQMCSILAETYEKMDNHEKATELYKELQNWYQVDLAIALIRHRMRKVAEKYIDKSEE